MMVEFSEEQSYDDMFAGTSMDPGLPSDPWENWDYGTPASEEQSYDDMFAGTSVDPAPPVDPVPVYIEPEPVYVLPEPEPDPVYEPVNAGEGFHTDWDYGTPVSEEPHSEVLPDMVVAGVETTSTQLPISAGPSLPAQIIEFIDQITQIVPVSGATTAGSASGGTSSGGPLPGEYQLASNRQQTERFNSVALGLFCMAAAGVGVYAWSHRNG